MAQREVIAEIDVLIDGRFIEAEKDARLLWRGSRNQTIWYLRQPQRECAEQQHRHDVELSGVPEQSPHHAQPARQKPFMAFVRQQRRGNGGFRHAALHQHGNAQQHHPTPPPAEWRQTASRAQSP